MTRLHWVVRGNVQGVGYRWFVRETAETLGVSGWVRNLPDGSVEGEAEGEAAALKRFVDLLRKGHPFARVDALAQKTIACGAQGTVFEIR